MALKRMGPLDLVRRIGSGAVGAIYEAQDPKTGDRYVVKVLKKLNNLELRRFKQEAELMHRMNHPNLMPVVRVAAEANPPHFVMPLRDGRDLSKRIHAGMVSLPFTLGVARDVARGLTQAHYFGVVHRDVKPANVFLDGDDERAVLLDFGLAKRIEGEHITQSGALLGTPAYMAPEQCLGAAVCDRTDVYALGVVLVELLLGVNPFRTPSLLMTISLHVEATPRRLDALLPKRVPRELGELVARMIAKEPNHRPRAGSVANELDHILKDRKVASEETPSWSVADQDSALAGTFYVRAA